MRQVVDRRLVHGEYGTPLYKAWEAMRRRCNNSRYVQYKYHGGRGIKVCERWNTYVNFATDVGPHPGCGLTLDRIDNNRGYEPGNVRWASRQTQARNRNYCKLDTAKVQQIKAMYNKRAGVTQEVLAAKFGISRQHISKILRGEMWK
jgi:DNA-binding XRE family transcriptional regulator